MRPILETGTCNPGNRSPEPKPGPDALEGFGHGRDRDFCDSCAPFPGVLFPCNGSEIQRCDTCADWSDGDAAAALRAAFPWLVVDFVPDTDPETDAVTDPAIGAFVVDLEKTTVPSDAPEWLAERIAALLTGGAS